MAHGMFVDYELQDVSNNLNQSIHSLIHFLHFILLVDLVILRSHVSLELQKLHFPTLAPAAWMKRNAPLELLEVGPSGNEHSDPCSHPTFCGPGGCDRHRRWGNSIFFWGGFASHRWAVRYVQKPVFWRPTKNITCLVVSLPIVGNVYEGYIVGILQNHPKTI